MVHWSRKIRTESDIRQMTSSSSSVILEATVSDDGELSPLWPTSRSGERKDLDQDVGGCDQDRASGAVPAEQWTGEAESIRTTAVFICS